MSSLTLDFTNIHARYLVPGDMARYSADFTKEAAATLMRKTLTAVQPGYQGINVDQIWMVVVAERSDGLVRLTWLTHDNQVITIVYYPQECIWVIP